MLGAAGWVLVLAVLFRLLAVGFAPGLLRFSDETTGALQDAMHLEDAKGWLRLDKCDWQRGIRGGLTRTFQRAALEVSGYRPGSLLALSIIQGSLVAVLLLLLGWLAFGRGVGLVAGGLGAAMPVMLGASLWPEATSTAVFIFLLGLTLMVAALRGEEPTRVRAVSALLGGLVVGAAVLARFEFGLLALFVGLELLRGVLRRRRAGRPALLFWLALAGLATGSFYVPFCERITQGSFFFFFTAQAVESELGTAGRPLGEAVGSWLRLVVIALGPLLPFTLGGMWLLLRRGAVLPVLGPVALLGFLVWRGHSSTLNEEMRYVVVIVTAGLLAAAVGAQALFQRCLPRQELLPRHAAPLSVVACLLALAFSPPSGDEWSDAILPILDEEHTELIEQLVRSMPHGSELVQICSYRGLGSNDLHYYAPGAWEQPERLVAQVETCSTPEDVLGRVERGDGNFVLLVDRKESATSAVVAALSAWQERRHRGWSLLLAPGLQSPSSGEPLASPAECPAGMVFIRGGALLLGVSSPSEEWHEPARSALLADYCIDRYEYPNVEGELPVEAETWDQATRSCRERGRRLCSSAEWERACRGPSRHTYSYGDQYDPQRCNTPIEGGGWEGATPPIAASGAHPECHSPEGVYDLNGNLSEWVSDAWSEFAPPFKPDAVVDPATWRTVRGGTMWDTTFYGQDCTSRHGHPRTEAFQDDGFRCCAEPL